MYVGLNGHDLCNLFLNEKYRKGGMKGRKRQKEKKERGRKRRVVEEKKGKIKLFG